MKKLLALLLALVMVFSLVACNNDKKDDDDCKHKDKDGDGICDKCDADMDDVEDEGGLKGSVLTAAIMAQLETAKSVKADFTYELDATVKSWTKWDDYGNEVTPYQETMSTKATITGSAVFSLTDTGFNAQITLNLSADQDGETMTQVQELYIIDGYVYTYNEYAGAYEKEELHMDEIDMAEIEAMLGTALEGVEIDTTAMAEATDKLLAPIIKAMSIEDGKGGSYTFKGKKLVNDFVAYINNLDFNTAKVSKVVNDVLALVDKELTVSAILDEAERVLGLTVNQLLNETDEALTKEYKTTIQGIFDDVMANEEILLIIENALVASGYSETEAKEQIEAIKALKIADLLTQAGVGDYVIWDLIASEAFGSGAPTKAEFFDQIESILNLTIAEFEDMIGEEIFTEIKETIGTLVVDELELSADLKLNKGNTINKLMYKGKAAFSVSIPWETDETKTNSVTASMNYTVNVHSVSDKTVSIALPAGAKILENLPYADLYVDGEYVGYVSVYMYSSQVEVYMYYYDYEVAEIS